MNTQNTVLVLQIDSSRLIDRQKAVLFVVTSSKLQINQESVLLVFGTFVTNEYADPCVDLGGNLR